MTAAVGFGIALALGSSVALNWGWVAQHAAASALPRLELRHPVRALALLFRHRRWLVGFAVGLAGWALYVAALALAPLSLVQAVAAGGIGLLALFAGRSGESRAGRAGWPAVAVSVAGLGLLALSLQHGAPADRSPAWSALGLWLVCSVAVAALLVGRLASLLAGGAGLGLAAGVLYGAGDVATKGAVGGGTWLLLVPAVLAAHGLAFAVLQLGFQRGDALRTAGPATLLTNALPIAAGLAVFHERLPSGTLGALRLAAFALVVVGAALLARDDPQPADRAVTIDGVGTATV